MPFDVPTYPVSLVLAGQSCLVVGGGSIALRKVRGLLDAGALVTVVAPTIVTEFRDLPVVCEHRPYADGEAARYAFVVAATGLDEIDSLVARDAQSANVLINVADSPASCSVILPAIARFGPVSIAVSSDGTSPALARWARDVIAVRFGDELAFLAPLVGDVRTTLHAAGQSSEGRDWRALIDALLATRTENGGKGARELARVWAARWIDQP